MNVAELMEQQQNGMRLLSVKQTTPFDQTDARKFLFVYLAKATDKSRFTYYLNKRLETLTDDKKMPFLEQIKVQSEIAQRENKGLTATQTQWFDEYLQGFKATQQPTAQHDEQPAATVPAVPDEQPATPQIIDEAILKLLPDMYDLLIEDGVIAQTLTKSDFIGNISKGSSPTLKKGSSKWVEKIAKFKAFIKQNRPFFNSIWYDVVCSNAGLTADKLDRYNTESTSDFEKSLQKILQKKD